MKKREISGNKKINILKKHTKLLVGFIMGILITVTVYAVTTTASEVQYDSTASGLTSSNVQDAIDELKEKAASCE